MKIPENEIEYHYKFYNVDPAGRLFWWRNDLYRGIYQEKAIFYKKLFENGVIQRLQDKKLIVDTELTQFSAPGFDLVLKHRVIPFVSYVYEWPTAMVKNAALLMIELESELLRHGATLHDAHPWNILFDSTTPYFVDIGSIIPSDDQNMKWSASGEFRQFFYNPLILSSRGQSRIARCLMHDDEGVLDSDIALCSNYITITSLLYDKCKLAASWMRRMMPAHIRSKIRKAYEKCTLVCPMSKESNKNAFRSMQSLNRAIEQIDLCVSRNAWSNYCVDADYYAFSPSSDWTDKHRTVYNVLSQLSPKTVLDIASNRGWYSQLAARLGSRVVAFDNDESSITKLYNEAKKDTLTILPLVMDLKRAFETHIESPPAVTRFKCDMVLALAIVHHLVFRRNMRFDKIANICAAFSASWLLVEFIPADDFYVRQWWSEKYSWYTVENFVAELRKKFSEVKIFPSDPKPRVLLLCRK